MKRFINHETRERERERERERVGEVIIPLHNTNKRTNEDTFKQDRCSVRNGLRDKTTPWYNFARDNLTPR